MKTSDIQRLDLLTFPWSPQPLPTVFLGKLVLESSASNGGELDAGLADITPSAPRPGITTPEITRDESFGPQLSIEEFCLTLAAAAEASNIPIAFFARLIWQESEFRLNETSPAGAQGVAQFMPRTASEVGLDNPFDPLKALPASARFLRRLRDEFGNLGLAAAAYNAGSGRVRSWLARREELPAETRNLCPENHRQPRRELGKAIENLKGGTTASCPGIVRRHRGIVSEPVGCCRFRIACAGDQRYRPKGQARSGGSTRLSKGSGCREREIALDVDKAKNAQYRPHKIFWLGLENGKCKKAPRHQDGIGFLAIT